MVRGCQPHAEPPSWRTTPFRPYATAYSVYSQLPSIPRGLPSIHNLRMRHAVVIKDPPNVDMSITYTVKPISNEIQTCNSNHKTQYKFLSVSSILSQLLLSFLVLSFLTLPNQLLKYSTNILFLVNLNSFPFVTEMFLHR
jgi:hypothetical protein